MTETEAQARRRRRTTLLVPGVALLGRAATVCFAVMHFPSAWFFWRGQEMGLLGDALLHGLGLSSPFGPPTGPTAMIAPGYPLLVAGVFRLLGSYTPGSALLLMALHVALNVGTVWLILQIGRGLATERGAVCAALLWACSPPLWWMPTIFWETSFSCCLLLGAVAAALRLARAQASRSQWACAGAACAVAGLLNPALLPALLGMGALAAARAGGAGLQRAGLALLVFALVFSPWPVRNARVLHAFIPTRTTVGLELWMGNHAGATGFLDESLFPTFNPGELAAYRRLGELRYTDGKAREAKAYIVAHPASFVRLTTVRTVRFWSGTGSRGGSTLFALHALTTTLLGGWGAWRMLRSRAVGQRWTAGMLLLPLALFPLPYCVTHAEFRYRLVVDPLLAVLAARALGDLCERRRGRVES